MLDYLICAHEADYKPADAVRVVPDISRLIESLNRSAKMACMETIGSRVKALRKKAQMTQAQLAEKMGKADQRRGDEFELLPVATQAALSMIESDVTDFPSAHVLAGLCRVLGTTPDYIMYGKEPAEKVLSAEAVAFAKQYEALSQTERHNLRLLYMVARSGKEPDAVTWTAPGADASQPSEGMHGMDSGLQPFRDEPETPKVAKPQAKPKKGSA